MDNNRKNQETTTSFGVVMKNAEVQTHQQHIKRMTEDSRLMIVCQCVRVYIPDNFQPNILLNLCQTLKKL